MNDGITIQRISDFKIDFFGYFNIIPDNKKQDIVFITVGKELRRGSIKEDCSIYVKQSDNIRKISTSKTWNWQQGCMLHWIPDSSELVIFNDYDTISNLYYSKIVNVNTGKIVSYINLPISCLSHDGKFAYSLSFDRLTKLRPDYGYFNRLLISKDLFDDLNDGLFKIDLNGNRAELIVTYDSLIKLNYVDSMNLATHKINHIHINFDGSRLMFLHRWISSKGRYTRLMVCDNDGNNLQILNGDKMTSHSCWLDNSNILSFCHVDKYGQGYYILSDKTNKIRPFSSKMPKVDGHPSVSSDGRFIIFDTYPTNSRFSEIFLFDIENESLEKLGSFHQPLKFKKEMRVDLHPKWSYDNSSIFIESGHSGHRKLYKIQISKLLILNQSIQ